jgi:hypothetical protein
MSTVAHHDDITASWFGARAGGRFSDMVRDQLCRVTKWGRPSNQMRSVMLAIRTKSSLGLLLLAYTCASGAASAQVLVPGINVPAFPSAPPLQAQIPAIPQYGVAIQPSLAPAPQNSFSDRVTQCLQQGSAAGLTGSNVSAYSGQCANQ